MRKFISILLLVFVLLQLTGCSSGPLIRADKSMFDRNTVKNIALIGTGTIFWPRRGNKNAYIGLRSSKTRIEKVLPLFKKHLEDKGYIVTFAEPIAAAFSPKSYTERTMFDNYGEEGDGSKKTELSGDEPGFKYPLVNKSLQNAGIAITFELSDALSNRAFTQFQPSPQHINTILTNTNSDTVCQVRATGSRFTAGRGVGVLFLSLFGGNINNATESGSLYFICSDNKGKVLWQNSQRVREDPMLPELEQINMVLQNFPKVGKPLPKNCEANEKLAQYYSCGN